jgi:hypothetical protein
MPFLPTPDQNSFYIIFSRRPRYAGLAAPEQRHRATTRLILVPGSLPTRRGTIGSGVPVAVWSTALGKWKEVLYILSVPAQVGAEQSRRRDVVAGQEKCAGS